MTQPDLGRPFAWGVATSAFQIEGARSEGGKGDSIWDRFADDGRMAVGGEVACDHYHRWEEDLDLLAELGVNAYRFSISWPRINPSGEGHVNSEGLDFYDRLVDGLLERGIAPWPTLYHWDLPQALQDRGGWASRKTATAFARYAATVADRLGDRVRNWITHNEPWVSTYLGHLYGVFPPGLTDWETAIEVSHNMLLSHGRAVEAIREQTAEASIGITLDCRPARPASDTTEDRDATRHFDAFRNRWFFDPVFGMGYPDDLMRAFYVEGRVDAMEPAFVRSGDMETIATPIDFLGLNYYTTSVVSAGSEEVDDPEGPIGQNPPDGFTEMGWRIDPEGLRDYLGLINTRYKPKSIVISENGASFSDAPGDDGAIHDERRSSYITSHAEAVVAAAESGVPVDGYFLWSLLDNLEWVQGFAQRFGVIWVDHESQERIPKDSFHTYRELVSPDSRLSRALSTARSGVPEDVGIRLVTEAASGVASERLERWMDGYVLAWTSNDPEHIAALFSPGAVYDPQTADGELLGLEEIVPWWQEIGDDPENWEFDWMPVVETDEVAVVSASTRYLEPATAYRNLFVIRWGEDGRCGDFTEWYIEEDG